MNDLPEVSKLLLQYKKYKSVQSQLEETERRLAKAKVRGEDTKDLFAQQLKTQAKLQQISDSMTFANPLIWIQYKYYAYQKEAQPILTMNDFRIHCSKPGYICTKRFIFVNSELAAQGLPTLDDKQAFSDSLELSRLFDHAIMKKLLNDKNFIKTWNKYEYFTLQGKAAKWQNYTPS